MARMNSMERFFVNNHLYNVLFIKTYFRRFIGFCSLSGRCLEIGCGPGYTSLELRKSFAISLISIDYDIREVEIAKKNTRRSPIRVIQADARALPFDDSSFDYVVESNTFHHIAEYKDAIAECYRVLRKGGGLYIMDASAKFFWPFTKLLPFNHFDGKFTKESLMADLEDHGFEIVDHKGSGIFFIHAVK